MKKAIILGNTNVGKTLFLLNFTEYIGYTKVFVQVQEPNGTVLNKEMSINNAKKQLSSQEKHTTRCIQSIALKIPVYKGYKELEVIDTTGLVDGIHPYSSIRRAIAQTLEYINDSNIIIHIIDVSEFMDKPYCYPTEIDKQIMRFGQSRGRYVLLVNKMDTKDSSNGLVYIKKNYKDILVIPISALYKTGFNEVKRFVIHTL